MNRVITLTLGGSGIVLISSVGWLVAQAMIEPKPAVIPSMSKEIEVQQSLPSPTPPFTPQVHTQVSVTDEDGVVQRVENQKQGTIHSSTSTTSWVVSEEATPSPRPTPKASPGEERDQSAQTSVNLHTSGSSSRTRLEVRAKTGHTEDSGDSGSVKVEFSVDTRQ